MINVDIKKKSILQLEKEISSCNAISARLELRNELTEKLIYVDRVKAIQQNEICLKEAQEIGDQKLIALFKFKQNAGFVFSGKFNVAKKRV